MNFLKSFLSLRRFKVKGKSMQPFLKDDNRVLAFTDKKSLQNLSNSEIVIAKNPSGREVIKRVKELKNDKVFLLGDNARKSTDSRHFGFIDKSSVIGKFWKKY